jgi:hypothetical protein
MKLPKHAVPKAVSDSMAKDLANVTEYRKRTTSELMVESPSDRMSASLEKSMFSAMKAKDPMKEANRDLLSS